jgi:hypothetical protein
MVESATLVVAALVSRQVDQPEQNRVQESHRRHRRRRCRLLVIVGHHAV